MSASELREVALQHIKQEDLSGSALWVSYIPQSKHVVGLTAQGVLVVLQHLEDPSMAFLASHLFVRSQASGPYTSQYPEHSLFLAFLHHLLLLARLRSPSDVPPFASPLDQLHSWIRTHLPLLKGLQGQSLFDSLAKQLKVAVSYDQFFMALQTPSKGLRVFKPAVGDMAAPSGPSAPSGASAPSGPGVPPELLSTFTTCMLSKETKVR
jgi:hypothetical protein